MTADVFVARAFLKYLDRRRERHDLYALKLADSGRTERECEDAYADYIGRLAVEFQRSAVNDVDPDVTEQLVEDFDFHEFVDTGYYFEFDGTPRDRFGTRRAGSASKASRPKAKAPAKKPASKPRSKGARR